MSIRVLHAISVDKQNYYLNNLADHSDANEVEHSFVTFAPESCEFVSDMKARGRRVFGLDTMQRSRYPRAFRKLWRLFNEIGPDIVHTHLFDPSLIGLTIAKWQGRKTVLTRHHSDAIHEISSPAKRRFYLSLENYISRKSDYIIAPSQMVRDFLVDKEGAPSEKVSIIPYGQTTARFDAVTPGKIAEVRAELGMGHGLALVNVSRLFHRKGHKYLFEAFSELVKEGLAATLYLVGEGDFRGELETMCAELDITKHVKFLGWRNDALAIVAAGDIVVHPSLEDALSSAVIESIMLEKPIVATDISGVRDSLGDGKYGKIVLPADSESFCEGLKETINNLADARMRAKDGRKYLLKYMDATRVAQAYADIYNKLTKTG